MYYILFYKTTEDYLERRSAYRPEHLDLINSYHAEGDLVMAGALSDPADSAVFIFKGESTQAAKDFANNDPYVKNGLIVEWKVRPWNVVAGGE